MTPAFIKGRADIFAKTYQWYQKLDASYFKVYTNLRRTLNQKFAPLTPAWNDLRAAYDVLSTEGLSAETAQTLSDFFIRINQTLDSTVTYGVKNTLMTFGMMMPSELTMLASNFKYSVMWSPMYTIFSHLTMGMEPVDDSCVTKTLSKFGPIIEPYVSEIIHAADQLSQTMPAHLSDLTTYIQTAVIEVRSFIKRINSCAKSTSREFCIDQIVSKTLTMKCLKY